MAVRNPYALWMTSFALLFSPSTVPLSMGIRKIVEDVVFVATQQPREVAHRGEPRMRRPPEPAREVPLRPARPPVLPEAPEELFKEIGAVDLEVEPLECAEAAGLALGEIPRVLQPDEPRLVHQRLVGRPLLTDLVASDLIDGLHEMAHDVELVEHEHRLGRAGLDDVDVRLPHIAANAFERRRFLRAEDVEERLEGLRGAPLPAPHQPLAFEVVDVGDVDVPAFSGDLIDPDVGHVVEIPMCQAIGDRLLDGRGHGVPRAPEQPRDLLPGQGPGPRCERHHQRVGHLLFSTDPGHRLDMHAGAPRTVHAPRRINEAPPRSPTGAHGERAVPGGCSGTSPVPHTGHTGARTEGPGPARPPIPPRPPSPSRPETLAMPPGLDQTFQEHESLSDTKVASQLLST